MIKSRRIPKSKALRMINWSLLQNAKTQRCPVSPTLENKVVALTGGNRGIGMETAKGLLKRGAEVIILSRNEGRSQQLVDESHGKLHFVQLDLGDVDTIPDAVANINNILNNRKIDILINNAGISVRGDIQLSPQGYELTFAVNVLGHHLLFQQLHLKSMLGDNVRIISVTGDLYFMADGCSPENRENAGMASYASSKLGVFWWSNECHKRYPEYHVNAVHPGVIPMGLGTDPNSIPSRIMSAIMLSPKGGAQTTLLCATQPDIENGAYYNNVYGKAILAKGDIALDEKSASALWSSLEEIYNSHFKTPFNE